MKKTKGKVKCKHLWMVNKWNVKNVQGVSHPWAEKIGAEEYACQKCLKVITLQKP